MIDRELTPDVIDDIRAHGPIDDLRVLPIALSMDPPEGVDVARLCLDLIGHPDAWVRGNAVTGFRQPALRVLDDGWHTSLRWQVKRMPERLQTRVTVMCKNYSECGDGESCGGGTSDGLTGEPMEGGS